MSVITRAASKDSEMKAAEPEPSTKLPVARKPKAAANQKKASLPIEVPSLNVEKVLEVIDDGIGQGQVLAPDMQKLEHLRCECVISAVQL